MSATFLVAADHQPGFKTRDGYYVTPSETAAWLARERPNCRRFTARTVWKSLAGRRDNETFCGVSRDFPSLEQVTAELNDLVVNPPSGFVVERDGIWYRVCKK